MFRNQDPFIGRKVSGGWKIERYLSSGSFGSVYSAKRGDGRRGVIKIESSSNGSLSHEVGVLERVQELSGFPRLFSSGTVRGQRMAVMQRLGDSLATLMRTHRFQTKDVLKLGIQMVKRLRDLHSEGLVHRDLHAGNILTGDPREGEGGKMYLIDFGESGDVGGRRPRHMYGNLMFASNASLRLKKYGPKDDLESLVYLLVYLYKGRLPWSRLLGGGASTQAFVRRCVEMRRTMSSSQICNGLPSSIVRMLQHLRHLREGDFPDYDKYIEEMDTSLRERGHSENDPFSWE